MRSFSRGAAIGIVGCFVLTVLLVAPPAIHGDEWNLKTRVTMSHQFEVPGMVLQANTPYVFRLHDSPSTRNVVQIFNNDENQLLTMFIAISDLRLEPTDKTQFTFMETAPGFPVPIKEWFYPGRLGGLEFVYPKDQAARIAGYARQAPLTESAAIITKSETTTVVQEKPSVTESAPAEPVVEQQQVEQPAPVVEKAESEEVQREKPSEATPVAEEPAATEERELPATAGELPMFALIGALCLGAGLGLKVLSAKS